VEAKFTEQILLKTESTNVSHTRYYIYVYILHFTCDPKVIQKY